MLYSIVSVLVIILDQAVKNWVSSNLPSTDVVRFIPGVISLVNVHNDGAAFSFLSGGGARIYFIIITGVFTVAVIVALATNFISGRLSRWSLVLVTAGGLSNCIDRIIYGYVQDMFKVELFDFAIFNVADIFITVFALVFALAMIFERQEDDEDEYYDEDEDKEDEPKKPRERKPLLSRFKREDSLDEDDDEPKKPRERRKSRKPDFEEEYEQYKRERAAREQAQRRNGPASQLDAVSDDPFAEWERANAKLGGPAVPSYRKPAAPAQDEVITPRRSRPAQDEDTAPRRSRPAQDEDIAPRRSRPAQTEDFAPRRTAPVPTEDFAPRRTAPVPTEDFTPRAAKPAQTEDAAPRRAAPAKAKPSTDSGEFNLDDILAEFK